MYLALLTLSLQLAGVWASFNELADSTNVDDSLYHYLKRNYFDSLAGLEKQSRIVGGSPTNRGRYPYQVALTSHGFYFCAGTLIAPEWVLSAAHCEGYATHVEIGRYNHNNVSETFETIEVETEILHPRFDVASFDFDFMLLKLKNPSNHSAVKLDDGSIKIPKRQTLTVVGWGKTSTYGNPSDILLEVEVDFFPNSRCKRRYDKFRKTITGRMMCASRFGKDACQGDSGGPLILKGGDSSQDIQVGLVSWGLGCANTILPGVYARVSKAIEFIETYVPELKALPISCGKDACQGDSGGSLIPKGGDSSQDIHVGLVSWGLGFANTILSKVIEFIETYVPELKALLIS